MTIDPISNPTKTVINTVENGSISQKFQINIDYRITEIELSLDYSFFHAEKYGHVNGLSVNNVNFGEYRDYWYEEMVNFFNSNSIPSESFQQIDDMINNWVETEAKKMNLIIFEDSNHKADQLEME